MKVFSMPADFKEETINEYEELNHMNENMVIRETYGQVTEGYLHMSGRAKDTIFQIGMKDLEKYVEFSKKRGMEFNYTLNAACFGNYEFSDKGIREIKELLHDLQTIGVNHLTLTTPSVMELVKDLAPDMKIKASAICEINSVKKMNHYKDIGVERFVVEPDLTRNFAVLKNMVKLGKDMLEIIINDKCLRDCPYKIFHYNQTAHDNDKRAESYYFMNCGVEKSSNPQNYLNLNWIRPEDLHLYETMGIRYFKVEGREFMEKGNIIKFLKAYIDESFDGNLLDLLHIFSPYDTAHQPYIDNKSLDGYVEGFYDNNVLCDQICDTCGYCKKFMDRSFTMPVGMVPEAVAFYRSKNKFIERLSSEAPISVR